MFAMRLHSTTTSGTLASLLCQGKHKKLRGFIGSLSEDFLDYFAGYVGEAKIAAGVAERQLFMIEAQQVKNGCVKIMHVNFIFRHFGAVIVRLAISNSPLDAPAGQPG